MTDNTEYTSESDILDSFVYNLLPIFLFTTNFLDDNWNYTNSIGRRIFDDAIFLGTPFIGTLILLWIKSDDIIWPSILYTFHLSFFIIYFVATRAWLNHGKLNHKNLNLTHEEDVKHIKYVYEKIIWKVWIHRILFLLTMSQIILIIFNLVFMYKFFPKRHSTKIDYKYYIWVVFPCFVAIFYSIVQSLIVYRKEEDEKDKENKKDEVNMENMEDVEDVENMENEKDKENIKNEVNMENMDNKEDEEENESKNKKLIETITRFIIWSILHGIIVTELWIFPISAYFTKFYLLLYINCVTLIFRYDSPKDIKFGVGFLNFIFIENSNNFKENSHLPVKYFFYLDHMDKDKNKENKDFVHNNRFKNIRSLYLK